MSRDNCTYGKAQCWWWVQEGLGHRLPYLAAAGIGTLGLVDFDTVDISNLQRQVLHGTSGVGMLKVESARHRLADLNPHVHLDLHELRLTSENARQVIAQYDVVVDGSDNFPTRYLVNDACVLEGKPYVYGAIFRFEGQASVFGATDGPCYRCLFREPPPSGTVPSCAEAGVLGVLPGIIGSLQALEAIKLLLGAGDSLVGRLVLFDALKLEFRELALSRGPDCPVCGDAPTLTELVDYEEFCGLRPQVPEDGDEISVHGLSAVRKSRERVLILDVRGRGESEICRIDGAVLIPLGQLAARLGEVETDVPIVTLCHTGVRSMRALEILRASGFSDVKNLRGGIDAWAAEIETKMARY